MAFSKETKSSIDLIVPAGAAAYMAYNLYTKGKGKKQWQQVLIPAAIVFAIVWLVTTRITKAVLAKAEQPEPVKITPDLPSAGSTGSTTPATGFNPKPYTDRLKADIYSYGFRDGSIYSDLVALSTAELVSVYNDWNARYYSLDNETMIQAMNGENYGIGLFNPVPANVKSIIERLAGQGAN